MAKDSREYDYEGEMVIGQLKRMINASERLHKLLKPDTNLPEWVQSKITLALDYIETASSYVEGEMNEEVQIDELSSDTLKSYKTKAFADARSTDDDSRARKRMTGAHKASFKVSKREMDSSYKEDLPNMLKDLRSKKKSHANMRREYGGSWKRLQNRTAAEHGHDYNRDHLLATGKKHMKEEAPANAVGGGNIAGMGVGPQGEPGVGKKAHKKHKDRNAAAAPKAGRKSFAIFMKGK
jgi:hypothetical protein